MTLNCNFPIEDQYYANNNEAIVADGITRDPIGVGDLKSISFTEMLDKYPRPSGGELAARKIVESFINSKGTVSERLIECNRKVKELNDYYIKNIDYLENDYYGAVAACISIDDFVMNYSYICDCGVIVYDKLGNIKFKTDDDKELYSDPYIDRIINNNGIPWNLPNARVIVRKEYRNNINNIQDKKCVSYGAITGEKAAVKFIKSGKIDLNPGDRIIVYSDGFSKFLNDKEFIRNILDFNKENFEKYVEEKSITNYQNLGKEKTLVLFMV